METVTVEVVGQDKREDSLKKRYAYKLGANLLGLPITLGIQAIVTRMLGPAAYGNYSFLNTFFTQIVSFFDSGISAGFYSKLSQRPNESSLVRFFWLVVGILSTLVIVSVFVILRLGWAGTLWPDQEIRYVLMAAVWGLLTWYSQVINKAMDAYGLTVSGEIVRFQQKVLGLALILVMFWLRRFSLTEFYLYQYAVLLFLCITWGVVLQRNGRTLFSQARLTAEQRKNYTREFYTYSAPLIILGVVALIDGVVGRWLLQTFAGSVQQGFFGLSYQIGALCFLVSGAMTPLFWREISKAFGDRDLPKMQSLFGRTVRMMYVVTAFLCVFVAIQADKVSLIMGGSAFKQAALPISIMVLFPIHQTYGQLTGSFMLGTGQTALYRNLGVITIVFGLLLSLWLLAPTTAFGLGLGAAGLALKLVIEQFVSVSLLLWFIARFLHASFRDLLLHQFIVLGSLIGLAWISAAAVDLVIKNSVLAFLGSGIIYAVGSAAFVFLFPSVVGMSRTEVKNGIAVVHRLSRQRLGLE